MEQTTINTHVHPFEESYRWVYEQMGLESMNEMMQKQMDKSLGMMGGSNVLYSLLADPWLYFGSFCEVYDPVTGEYENLKLNEACAMATQIIYGGDFRHDNYPVFINSARQTGKTCWLLSLAVYCELTCSCTHTGKKYVMVLAKSSNDAKHLQKRTNYMFPPAKCSCAEKILFRSIADHDVIDLITTGSVRGTDIHAENTLLFLDEYEFYREDLLLSLISKKNWGMIVAGVSTLKRFGPVETKPGIWRVNPLQVFFDRICIQMDDADAITWLFEGSMLPLIQGPVRIKYSGHRMMCCKNAEESLQKSIGDLAMSTKYYMSRL